MNYLFFLTIEREVEKVGNIEAKIIKKGCPRIIEGRKIEKEIKKENLGIYFENFLNF